MNLGLIGHPLSHSYSQRYFLAKFKAENISGNYNLFDIPDIRSVKSLLEDSRDIVGLNVTIPYKEDVIPYLDELSDEAKDIHAVNTIKILRSDSGKIIKTIGYNTDWIAFSDTIRPMLGRNATHALILGTGGASKAVKFAFDKMGIVSVLVSRNPIEGKSIGYQNLTKDIIDRHLIIVNTTPLGMYPNTDSCPDIPYDLLTNHHICYDLVYNPEVTEFMVKAASQGAVVKNGLEMLHLQAEHAYRIWQQQ